MSSSWKKQRRQDILQAASTVLLGSTIRANDRVAIKAVMSNYPAEFKSVVKMYGSDMVVGIISSLLDNGRLALESSAQLGFPETHQPSAVRDRQHNALEQAAAQSEAKALDKASRSDVAMYEGDQGGEQIDVTEAGPIEDSSGSISSKSPSLFPSYLSYTSQHKLLNTVQRILEDCCYDWVAKWIPSLLEERKWTCSEAVELSSWSATIPQRFDAFSFDATSLGSGAALSAVFQATHPLRHAAVHRLHTSVKGIERMLRNALDLATALQDIPRGCKLHDVLMDFRATMQTMESIKNDLENQLDEELRNIQVQRAALETKEREARLGMFQQDREHTSRISCLFEKSIKNLTSMDEPCATGIEQENARNPESEEACDDAAASSGTPDKHSAEDVHQTTDEADRGNTDSKHDQNELSTTGDIPDNHSADDLHIATADAGCGNRDNKPCNQGDIEASTADSTEMTVRPIENESAATPAELDLDDPILPSQSMRGEGPLEPLTGLTIDSKEVR